MKRLFVFVVLATMIIGSTGCQSRMFGRRGTRCRSDASPPTVGIPGFQNNSANCGPEYNQVAPSMTAPNVIIPNGAIITEQAPMTTGPMTTGPIVEGGQVGVQRQVVPGTITVHEGPTIMTVPGPESAPLPRS